MLDTAGTNYGKLLAAIASLVENFNEIRWINHIRNCVLYYFRVLYLGNDRDYRGRSLQISY